ncbi:MAG: hypothetical protein NC915_04730 [Candidatus Omnitrophica bacterium]|nr:hypothetical protein [Candidatus Omnitrophota bacterium]
MKKINEKVLNFGIGSFYYIKDKFKNILEEIEKKGEQHSHDFEVLKKEVDKLFNIPKKLFKEFIKSCGFITKEDFEKYKEEIKND